MKSRLQRTGQSLTTPKGEEASVGVFHDGDSRRSDHFHICTAVLDKESIVKRNECELARLFVSKNLGNTISAVLHYSGSWINFCLCWKVALIFMNICLLSVLCFSRDMASQHWSPFQLLLFSHFSLQLLSSAAWGVRAPSSTPTATAEFLLYQQKWKCIRNSFSMNQDG